MNALLTAIVVWLSVNFGLPANFELPRIERMSSTEMKNLIYENIPADQRQAMSVDQIPRVISLYSVETKTIYLPPEWTGRTPAELSELVHEMVHHSQNLSHATFLCPAEREKLAYEAQEKWLVQYGKNLESEFGLDPMSVLVKSLCN